MTILVGMLCQDGVVMGADSSATFGPNINFKTIEQPVQKLFIIGNAMIMSGTGPVGLAQRFEAILSAIHMQKDIRKNTAGAIAISKDFCAAAINDFCYTQVPKGQFGALVAFVGPEKKFYLVEFGADFQPEQKTPQMWFASMGSGQPIVDPFLGLLRGVLFDGQQPKLSEGVFATYWALEHAIELNPGGINGPPQIAVIGRSKDEKGFMEARLLSEEEMGEHKENVIGMRQHMATYRDILASKSTPKPIPPAPPI